MLIGSMAGQILGDEVNNSNGRSAILFTVIACYACPDRSGRDCRSHQCGLPEEQLEGSDVPNHGWTWCFALYVHLPCDDRLVPVVMQAS